MANSDYSKTGFGSFAPVIDLLNAVDHEATVFEYAVFNFQRASPVEVGAAGMIDNEIVMVTEENPMSFTVKRGCADTIPAPHAAGTPCWFFDQTTGTDAKEYGATQVIGVKPTPFTTGGGAVPLASVAPDTVTFNWRFFRPYPPAQMRVNGARWYVAAAATSAVNGLSLAWVDRDRVLQGNQLLGHDEPTIGPEPGASYTMRVYTAAGEIKRTETGLMNKAYAYQWSQMMHDFSYPTEPIGGYITLCSHREGLDSLASYRTDFTLDNVGTVTSNFLQFDQRAMESPYMTNLLRAAPAEGNFAVAVAARPADRQADVYQLVVDAAVVASDTFTAWVSTDFRLPELETTLNIRTTSRYDGVPVDAAVGQLALIDDELVEIKAMDTKTVTIGRGCADTVPAVHLPGAKLWLIDQRSTFDPTGRALSDVVNYKLRPVGYGPAVDDATLPSNPVTVAQRSLRPYAPGQVVVNGRPWFEEATSISGTACQFSWARRNRVSQASEVTDHVVDDIEPEVGQVTRLTFYYTTPSATPGAPADVHTLRTVTQAGTFYEYPYADAQADGAIAGPATGVCGTVVISVKIEALRDGLTSWQSYTVQLRIPTIACT